jgi:hypothetical protein
MKWCSWRKLCFELSVEQRQLEALSGVCGRYYDPFDMRRRGRAKWRHIDNPTDELKLIQRRIQRGLLTPIDLPASMNGGIGGRDVRSNALLHVRQPVLVTLDLRNYFGRIDHRQVFRVFSTEVGCSPEIAHILTKLTTFQGRLPHGAPTSSMLANLVFLRAHQRVSLLCAEAGLTYSVFVDDLAISGKGAHSIIQDVIGVLALEGFVVSPRKISVMHAGQRQAVNGQLVNVKLSTLRAWRDDIRTSILEAKSQGFVTRRRLQSIWGRITFATHMNREQGRALADFAQAVLPSHVIEIEEVVVQPDERRACLGPRSHRHHPNTVCDGSSAREMDVLVA